MRLLAWFALAPFLSPYPLFAQSAKRIDPCHAMPTGGDVPVGAFRTFDNFDRELRVAIARQDAVALAFLVTFPLRVNDEGGTISLDDAAALQTHFQEVFTPAVRKEILGASNENVECNAEGIGYARGVIWVNTSSRGYAIWSVNRDAVPPFPESQRNTPKINYICQTNAYRIVIDSSGDGGLRYRSWNKPRSVMAAPDLEIAKGIGTFEGTNVCAVPIYTFKKADAEYRVEGGLGCFGDSGGPPKEATGRLGVTLAGKPELDSWCY